MLVNSRKEDLRRRSKVFDPHYFQPNKTLRVVHINYFHIDFPLIMIGLHIEGLFTSWTLKVVSCSLKICDWLLNSSQDQCGLHQGKTCKSNMELEAPNSFTFRHTYPLSWSKMVCGGERGKTCFIITKIREP